MDDLFIVFAYTLIDDLWSVHDPVSHPFSHLTDAEIVNMAVLAAALFQNHHERAVPVLCAVG